MNYEVRVVSVFGSDERGGNPSPIVVDADDMTDDEMRAVAQKYGHESGFVFSRPNNSGCDFEMRYWVPLHEMSMCGHATVGGMWLLDRLGRLPRDTVSIWTKSGKVDARISCSGDERLVEVSQPRGLVEDLPEVRQSEAEILSILGITSNELAPLPIQNACTSRVKTLIPLKNVDVLNSLRPDFKRMESLCTRINSTGLYPYAIADLSQGVFEARQFPKASGYPEDAATGIAAAALAFGLLENGLVGAMDEKVLIRQGRAMGRPSEISVRFKTDGNGVDGCWIGGSVRMELQPEIDK